MKVTVFGIGYVGLVQAAVLAEVGHDVVCVDIDQNKVDNLKRGIIPIYEPGLEPIVKENSQAGRLHFTTDAAEGIAHGTLQFRLFSNSRLLCNQQVDQGLKQAFASSANIMQKLKKAKVKG